MHVTSFHPFQIRIEVLGCLVDFPTFGDAPVLHESAYIAQYCLVLLLDCE